MGPMRTMSDSPPYRLSETPWRITRRPPLLGEHNAEVYTEWLGLTAHDLEDLKTKNVL